jgi:molecular chaperone DnaJ
MLTGIDGEKLTLTVPPGAQAGQRLRLRGKGMSILKRSGRGDLYVELGIETPVHLSSKQKELLRSFVASLDEKNIPQSHHFRSS